MKYLKKFNEELQNQEIINDINDIFLELKDEGFIIRHNEEFTNFYIYKNGNKIFRTDEVTDVVERLKDYLSDRLKHHEVVIEPDRRCQTMVVIIRLKIK